MDADQPPRGSIFHADSHGAGAFGFALSLKFILLPVLFALALLPRMLRDKGGIVATGLLVYLAPIALSLALHPHLFGSFVKGVSGSLPGQYHPSAESYNPAVYWFIRHLIEHRLNIQNKLVTYPAILAVYAGIGAAFLFPIRRIIPRSPRDLLNSLSRSNEILIQNPQMALKLTFFCSFVIMMLLPRVKEYGYFDGMVLATPMIAELPALPAILAAAAAVLLPMATNQPRYPVRSIFDGYDQVVCALLTMAIVAFFLHRRSSRNDGFPKLSHGAVTSPPPYH